MFINKYDMPVILAHICKSTDACPIKAFQHAECPFLVKKCSEITELAWRVHLGFIPLFDPDKFGFDTSDVLEVGYTYDTGLRQAKRILIERELNTHLMTFYKDTGITSGVFESYYVVLEGGEKRYLSNDEYLTLRAVLSRFA